MKKTLSIITVVKNDEKNIQKTIRSILQQKKKNLSILLLKESPLMKHLKKF